MPVVMSGGGRRTVASLNTMVIPGEQVLFRTRLHWAVFLMPGLVLVAGLWLGARLVPIALAAVLAALAYATYSRSVYMLTDRRVLARTGLLRMRVVDLPYEQVRAVVRQQGILGTALGYGTVVLLKTDGAVQRFGGVAKAPELMWRIENQLAVARRRNPGTQEH